MGGIHQIYDKYLKIVNEKDSIFYIQRVNYHCIAPLLVHKLAENKVILDIDDWEMGQFGGDDWHYQPIKNAVADTFGDKIMEKGDKFVWIK